MSEAAAQHHDVSPNEASDQSAEFARKKTAYFVTLALHYKDLLQLHKGARPGGQWAKEEDQLSRIKKRPGASDSERLLRWGDPTEHCLVEAAAAGVLSDMLHLSSDDRDDLIKATFVHDYRKRGEIDETRGNTDPAAIEASYKKTADILLESGVSPKIVELTKAVAHTSLPQFAFINEATGRLQLYEDVPVVNMAVHYVDDITYGTHLVALDRRLDYLDDVAPTRYPYNEEGRSVWGGRTFFEAQREVGHLLENRLAEIAGVSEPTTLPAVINENLVQKITNFEGAL